jgi:hypothetical protein
MPARLSDRPPRPVRAFAAATLALACAPAAFAGVDDGSDGSGDGFGVIAFGRRVVEQVAATERQVVGAIRRNAAATSAAPTWQAAPAASFTGRAVDYAARANAAAANAVVADPDHPAPAGAEAAFGARWRVLQGDATTHVPVVSWMADVEPANPGGLARSNLLRPSVHLSAEWALTDDVSFGVMPGMAFDTDLAGRRQASGTLAVTLGKSWSPQWRTYVDLARDRLMPTLLAGATPVGGGPSTTLDAGITFQAPSGVQLDLALTHGLSAAAPDFQAGLGVSSRF